jgi:hypothetical protein
MSDYPHIKEECAMPHACPNSPEREYPCNAWCQPGDGLHVDLAYAEAAKSMGELQAAHDQKYACRHCRILACVLAHEAPTVHVRFPDQPASRPLPVAYRITYHVSREARL